MNKYKLSYEDISNNHVEKIIEADHFFFDEGFLLFIKKEIEGKGGPIFAITSDVVYGVELMDLSDIINQPIK